MTVTNYASPAVRIMCFSLTGSCHICEKTPITVVFFFFFFFRNTPVRWAVFFFVSFSGHSGSLVNEMNISDIWGSSKKHEVSEEACIPISPGCPFEWLWMAVWLRSFQSCRVWQAVCWRRVQSCRVWLAVCWRSVQSCRVWLTVCWRSVQSCRVWLAVCWRGVQSPRSGLSCSGVILYSVSNADYIPISRGCPFEWL